MRNPTIQSRAQLSPPVLQAGGVVYAYLYSPSIITVSFESCNIASNSANQVSLR